MVAVSACMSGTRGSDVLSSTGDMLEMSVARGVGGVCDMCLARGGVGGEGGEWMIGLGLGFTNPGGKGGVLDVCFGCGCVGGVGGEWVGSLYQGRERWCGVQTRLFNVVGPGLVSTSSAFVSSSASLNKIRVRISVNVSII